MMDRYILSKHFIFLSSTSVFGVYVAWKGSSNEFAHIQEILDPQLSGTTQEKHYIYIYIYVKTCSLCDAICSIEFVCMEYLIDHAVESHLTTNIQNFIDAHHWPAHFNISFHSLKSI